jgi:hypothetical protein
MLRNEEYHYLRRRWREVPCSAKQHIFPILCSTPEDPADENVLSQARGWPNWYRFSLTLYEYHGCPKFEPQFKESPMMPPWLEQKSQTCTLPTHAHGAPESSHNDQYAVAGLLLKSLFFLCRGLQQAASALPPVLSLMQVGSGIDSCPMASKSNG